MKTQYYVEYDFIDTIYGARAMWLKVCATKEEAEEFAKGHADAQISEYKQIQF